MTIAKNKLKHTEIAQRIHSGTNSGEQKKKEDGLCNIFTWSPTLNINTKADSIKLKNVKNAIINNKYKSKVFKWDDKRTNNGVAVFKLSILCAQHIIMLPACDKPR